MARIVTEGIEGRALNDGPYLFRIRGVPGTVSYAAAARYTGDGGVSASVAAGGTGSGFQIVFPNETPCAEFYCSFGWIYGTATNGTWIYLLQHDTAFVALHVDLSTTTSLYTVYIGSGTSTALGTFPMNVITTNVWALVEFYFKRDASIGRFVLKIDSVVVFDYTGNTISGTVPAPTGMQIGAGPTSYAIDDICVNDISGSVDNSWLGNQVIVRLYPNADGALSQWMGSDGNQVNNYQLVDEIPFNSDTDYVSADNAGLIDEYDLYNPTTISATATISGVMATATAKRGNPNTVASLDVGVLSGATEDFATSQALTTSYKGYAGNFLSLNPDTGLAWTPSDLDALQVAIRSA